MPRAGQMLQLIAVALLGVGVVMVSSAGLQVGSSAGATLSVYDIAFSRHALYAGVAILAMLAVSMIDIRRLFDLNGWYNPIVWVFIVALGLTASTLIPGIGATINGASRWIKVGPITFQPSELVKWTMVLLVAFWCTRRQAVMHKFFPGLLFPLALVGLSCGLILIEDLGTAVLIGAVAMCMLIAGGARWWQLGLVVPPGVAVVVLAIIHSPYRVARLTAFMDPWQDPRGVGYHPIQSMLAFAQGGLGGRGLGNGLQKFGYLPADTTDFIFAVICEELGAAGAVMVMGLFIALLWIGLNIIRRCPDTFGRLVALGVIATVGLQALINIAVVTVVVPTKGIALPLISSGGTGWIMTAIALGLVAGMDRHNEDESDIVVGEIDDDDVILAQLDDDADFIPVAPFAK